MLVSKLLKFIFFPLLHTTSLVAGFRFRVTSSKCLISEPPGSLFFFCFNIECQLVRLWMTCALIWSCMNQWLLFSTIHTYFSQTHLIAWLGGVPSRDWISQALMQQSPLSRRRLFGGADAGAEPWYKTIAKLMQGRNRNSTHTLRTSCWCASALPASKRIVATWLILPVVICLS